MNQLVKKLSNPRAKISLRYHNWKQELTNKIGQVVSEQVINEISEEITKEREQFYQAGLSERKRTAQIP